MSIIYDKAFNYIIWLLAHESSGEPPGTHPWPTEPQEVVQEPLRGGSWHPSDPGVFGPWTRAKGKGVTRNSGPRHHFPSLSMMMSGNRSMAGVGPATPITGWHALVGCESRSFFWSAAGGAQNFVRKHVGNRWKEKQKKSSAWDPIFGGFAIEATPLPVLSTGPSCFTSGLSLNQTRYWDWHIYRHRPYSIYQPGTHLTSVLIG